MNCKFIEYVQYILAWGNSLLKYKLVKFMKLEELALIDFKLACPKNISLFWRFGSLLGVCLATQIVTGLFLAIYYASDISLAYDSVTYISRDVANGYLIRNIHANGASIFFVCLYIHMGRGLYYKSFSLKYTWLVGVTLFLLCIITAFLGYVLPWGQMSYWAATVITNLISAVPYIGNIVVSWLWGGFRVRNASLVRFYALHFLLPFVISGLSLLHIFFLHETGSSNPLGLDSSSENIEFQSYFTVKDSVGFLVIWGALGYLVLFFPNLLIDPENFIQANPLVTPTHIQPEWYFLPIYAMLRAIPSKLGGVIALILSVRILYTFPFLKKLEVRSLGFSISESTNFWLVVSIFIVLGWIGSQAVEAPFEFIGQIFTALYFLIIIL